MSLCIHRNINTPVSSNCYIISDKDKSDKCIIIDPGSVDVSCYENYLAAEGLELQYIILTHQHFDHCAGVNKLRSLHLSVQLVCSTYCNEGIQNPSNNLSEFREEYPDLKIAPANITFENDGVLEWNGYKVGVVPTRGHTSGSISIIIGNNIFTGDAWIKDTKTFTKFPTGNKEEQQETEKYFHSLHGMKVWPGHGDMFLLKESKY